MTTLNCVIIILFCFFGLPSYAVSADVVATAIRDENVIEVAKTYWTIELVNLSLIYFFLRVADWKFFYELDIALLKVCLYSYFIFFFEFLLILPSYFFQNSMLLLYLGILDWVSHSLLVDTILEVVVEITGIGVMSLLMRSWPCRSNSLIDIWPVLLAW